MLLLCPLSIEEHCYILKFRMSEMTTFHHFF